MDSSTPEYVPPGTVNLAVTTSKSSRVVQMVDTAVQYSPKSIFIMTGINDVSDGDLAGFTIWTRCQPGRRERKSMSRRYFQ